jgi:hypothetical protein
MKLVRAIRAALQDCLQRGASLDDLRILAKERLANEL